MNAQIDHPSYYNGGIEVIEFIDSHSLNFSRGNAIKYLVRAGKKAGASELDDLSKALWYVEHEIERLQKDEQLQ